MAKPVHGNHPYTEGGVKDKPLHITRDKIGYYTYPDFNLETSDFSRFYFSSDQLTVGTWDLTPGAVFAPPNRHPGDEVYLMLQGELTLVTPQAGQTVTIREEEAVWIPRQTEHYGYNFGKKVMRSFYCLAPRMVTGQLFPTDTEGHLCVLNDPNAPERPAKPDEDKPNAIGTIDHVGRWPMEGEKGRGDVKYLHLIQERDKLLVVNGAEKPYLMKFAVSNDLLNVGEMILPNGGQGCRYTEPQCHKGQAFYYVRKGELTFLILETHELFSVHEDEGMFIPENTEYQMINYTADSVEAVFAIAPAL